MSGTPDETLPVDEPEPGDASERGGSSRTSRPAPTVIEQTIATSRVHLREIEEDGAPVHRPLGATDEPELPREIGRYQIDGEIGRGGVGAVFKARDVDLGRDIAIKVLLGSHHERPEVVRRFVEEAQIGGQLQHPGIVPVHEMGLVGGDRPFFAMKLVKGQTLSRLLDERESPACERPRFLSVFEQICQPLAYAHARGVIHRDLKPSNIMVGPFGEVQVMDWGLAKVLARGGEADDRRAGKPKDLSIISTARSSAAGSESLAGSVLGTPAYMSPEQARGEIDLLDERSDVFGLGAILCEILTGSPPYEGETAAEVHGRALRGELNAALARIDECGADPEVRALARACLAIEPRERPPTAGAVARQMRTYLDSLDERAQRLAIEAAESRVRARSERKARALTVALAAVATIAIALGAGGYVWIEKERQDEIDQIRTRFQSVIGQARTHCERARLSAIPGSADWKEAAHCVSRARDLAVDAPDLLAQADEIEQRIQAEQRTAEFVGRLHEATQSAAYQTAATQEYTFYSLFRGYFGRDVTTMAPAELARAATENGCRDEVARALNAWLRVRWRVNGADWESLFRLVSVVDTNSIRSRAREALVAQDTEAFRALVDEAFAGPPPTGAELEALVYISFGLRAFDVGERILRRALNIRPNEWWLYPFLAGFFSRAPGVPDEELLRYLYCSAARIPKSIHAWHHLGSYLMQTERYGAAIDAYAHGAWLIPGHSYFHVRLAPALRFQDVETLGQYLDAFVELYAALLNSSDRLLSPFVRDVWALASAKKAQAEGRDLEALATLEYAEKFPASSRIGASELARLRRRLGAVPRSYSSADAYLEDAELLVAEGDSWRYFRGEREPSNGLEWARADFDDSEWPLGPSGFGYGGRDDATRLTRMRGRYTTVYVRKKFAWNPAEDAEALRLVVSIDDGFIAYLDGEEIGRYGLGETQTGPQPFDGTASRSLASTERVVVKVPATKLSRGEHVLAIQAFNSRRASSDLTLIPVVEVAYGSERRVEMARGIGADLRASEEPDKIRLAEYFAARFLQLKGKDREAVPLLRDLVEAEPDAPLPRLRLAESIVRAFSPAVAVPELRELARAEDALARSIWDEWFRLSTERNRNATQILAALPPASSGASPPRYVDELRWALETIERGEVLRINCGGVAETFAGRDWARDRFFLGGDISEARAGRWLPTDIEGTDEDSVFSEGRFFWSRYDARAGYKIPLVPGRYTVRLHFVESYFARAKARVFSVALEGNEVLTGYDTFASKGFAIADTHSVTVEVSDGFLDVTLIALTENPRISAIEVERADATE